MAENKKGFKLYADQRVFIDQLPDELAGKVFKHLFAYVNDENPDEDDLLLKLAFSPIKRQLKHDLKLYESIVERNQKNGKKGGRPKKPSGLNGLKIKPKKADKDKDKDIHHNDDVIVSVDKCLEMYLKESKIIAAISKSQERSTDEILKYVYLFAEHLKSTTQVKEYLDFKTHFLAWLKKQPTNKKQKTTLADVKRIWKPMI